jgi:hypothetical protein
MPFHCSYCGVPQMVGSTAAPAPYAGATSPWGAAAASYGAPPAGPAAPQNPFAGAGSPYGPAGPGYGAPPMQLQGPGAGLGAGGRGVIMVIPVVVAIVAIFGGAMAAFMARSHGGVAASSPFGGGSATTASLANISLAMTPDQLAKAIHGTLGSLPGTGPSMMINLSGGPYNRVNFEWDQNDASHVKMVYFYADAPPPGYSATMAAMQKAIGPRFDAKGSLNWHGALINLTNDTLYFQAMLEEGTDKNPHWKEQVDAAWDVVRSAALKLPVAVTQTEVRDWLGGGYSLTAIAGVDTTVDVDKAGAMMTSLFPGAVVKPFIGLDVTLAVDSPWFSETTLNWENAKGGALKEIDLRPPVSANNAFPNQADIDACVTSVTGVTGKRYESDHLKHDYDTTYDLTDGGSVRVYSHMVAINVQDVFNKKHTMSQGSFHRVLTGLDACAKKK